MCSMQVENRQLMIMPYTSAYDSGGGLSQPPTLLSTSGMCKVLLLAMPVEPEAVGSRSGILLLEADSLEAAICAELLLTAERPGLTSKP